MSLKPATRRWLAGIGIALAVIVVLVGAGLWWLLGSSAGLRFVLARASAASGGAIIVRAARGDLAGPMQLDGIAYRAGDGGMRAHVDHLQADIAVWSLLRGRLRLTMLQASGITVALPNSAQASPGPATRLSLEPPIGVRLDHAHISDVRISRDGQPVFVANSLDLAGTWSASELAISQLRLRAPDGHAELVGTLQLGGGASGKGHGSFQWMVDGHAWAGTLDAHSDGKRAQLALALRQPTSATLHVTVQQSAALPWTARIDAPTFDAKPFLGDSSIKTLALALTGHGDRRGGTLTGYVDLNALRLQVHPLTAHYDPDTQRVSLDRLVITSPQVKGTLSGRGTIDLASTPATAYLALAWRDVRVPQSMVGQALASAGSITLAGSTQAYRLAGHASIGPPGKLAHLVLDLTGTPTQVTLKQLEVRQPKGRLDTHGTVTLKPALAWDLTATGTHFNPGLLLAGWNGALDLDLATRGHLAPQGPDATFKLTRLSGHLRQRKLSGHGDLHVTPARVIRGSLALASGNSRLQLTANGKQTNHVQLDLAIASLDDWLPGASGALHGRVHVDGLWPKLAVKAHVRGRELAMGTRRAGSLTLDANVPDISHPGGTLDLEAGRLALAGFTFDTLSATGKGNAAHHTLDLVAKGQPLSLRLALAGQLRGKAWNGTLSTLDVDMQNLPPWHLQQPSQLAWSRGAMRLSNTCLTAGTPTLCVAAEKTADGTLHASYRLQQIPLELITTAIGHGLPLAAAGVIDGEGKLTRTPAGALSGHATLVSPRGKISYTDRPELPLLAYDDLRAQATLTPQRQHVTLAATFHRGGQLQATIDATGPEHALSGRVTARLDSLAPVELFTRALANVKGHLDADFHLGGTLAQPVLEGRAELADFAAEVPAAGLRLHGGTVTVATTTSRQLRLDGQVVSGKGTLQLSGTFGLGTSQPMQLHIRGANVLAADIPAAQVTVTPDLTVERSAQGLAITGTLGVDKARVELEKLPGAGATQASPDVVVVDAQKAPQENAALPIRADLSVDLGQHTHLVGYGLDGDVSGTLHVHQEPGRPTTGRGQIVINGTYKAYGQDLVIKNGRLLFASTPIDNPGLDIRAVRVLHPNATISDNQVVGLQISGTAKRPVMTVFSNPAMEQSDALSYLITGKPLSAIHGGEGNMVDAAAQALGSAAGNLLAKNIGARLGIEAGVSTSAALGTAAFTVGKYLSPRLYLSYGVGLFEPGQVITLRYILSRRWNFEAEQASDFSRASFNYRFEH